MANIKVDIDFKILDAMLQFNPTCRMVADHFNCTVRTIENRIREKYDMTFLEYKDTKLDRVRLKLQQTAIQMAFGKDRTMLIFCLKNLCKWSDRPEGPEDSSQTINIHIDSDDAKL